MKIAFSVILFNSLDKVLKLYMYTLTLEKYLCRFSNHLLYYFHILTKTMIATSILRET